MYFFHPFYSVFFKEARICFIGCAFFCKDYRYPVKRKKEREEKKRKNVERNGSEIKVSEKMK
jgi:hypothetical protein